MKAESCRLDPGTKYLPEKQMIFLFLCMFSIFMVGVKLVIGTERSFLSTTVEFVADGAIMYGCLFGVLWQVEEP